MARILVTGANGFVGRYVCRAAGRAGHRVVGMGHGDWPEEVWRAWGLAEWLELDVALASLVAQAEAPDAIVHCAGSGAVGFSFANPAQDFGRTVATTLDVLEYIRTCSPETAFD